MISCGIVNLLLLRGQVPLARTHIHAYSLSSPDLCVVNGIRINLPRGVSVDPFHKDTSLTFTMV